MKNEQAEINRLRSVIKQIAAKTKPFNNGGDLIADIHCVATNALLNSSATEFDNHISKAAALFRHPLKRGWPEVGMKVKDEVGA